MPRDYSIHEATKKMMELCPGHYVLAEQIVTSFNIQKWPDWKKTKRVYSEIYGHTDGHSSFRSAIKEMAVKIKKYGVLVPVEDTPEAQ